MAAKNGAVRREPGTAVPAKTVPAKAGPARAAPAKTGSAKKKARPAPVSAKVNPVARVAVDIPNDHLDRPFDYLVPVRLDAAAQPGVRVKVRFAGQYLDGFVLERAAESDFTGDLLYLDKVVSAEPVLTPETVALTRAVADRYGGTLADVLRLAVPPRHAATESEPHGERPDRIPDRPGPGSWTRYPAGPAFLDAVAGGRPARAAWSALPGGWPDEIARAAATCASTGRGTVIVVPDGRGLARVGAALEAVGAGHVTLTAELGPAERYRRWLAARRGETLIVAGTRAAMFAPVHDLGLVVLWDDGDDLHTDPRAPYPNAREVLALRAYRARAAALIGGFARSAELAQLVSSGWARPVAGDRGAVRASAPLIRSVVTEAEFDRDPVASAARLPALALRTLRRALADGPVLIQVPRRGYLAVIACARCRARAHCPACGGPLRLTGADEVPDCRWCGAIAGGWACPDCGATRVRAVVTGAERTGEELARAFPGVPVRYSSGAGALGAVPDKPALVIATPGAEPAATYAAGLLLDGWALLGRPVLRAAEEALRRWLNAAALVRPGGPVIVHADPEQPAVQALIRWDPAGFADRELADREELGFPPAVRMAAVQGTATAVADLLAEVKDGYEILGPVPVESPEPPAPSADGMLPEEEVRALVRAPRKDGNALAESLHAAQAARAVRKDPGLLRVQLDPAELI